MVVLIQINVYGVEEVQVVPSVPRYLISLSQAASCHQLQSKMIHVLCGCQPVVVAKEQGNLGVDLCWIIDRRGISAMVSLIVFRSTPFKTNELFYQ